MSAAMAHRRAQRLAQDLAVTVPANFALESGDVLNDGLVRLRRYGDADAPQIIALGGISAGRCVAGEGGWWANVVGASGAIDTDAFGVIGVDFAPLGDQRVRIAPRDQARLIALALDALGVARLHALVGASYGGMVGLAFAAQAPGRVERLCVISASHKPSALGAAWRGIQRRMVEFGIAHGDAAGGLALARQLAMTTYRSAEEFEARFETGVDDAGRSAVDAYLIARGEAYPRTMLPQRWLSLSEAIDRHAVDPAAVRTPTTLVGCSSDQLVPLSDIEALARRLPRLEALHVIPSLYGHDGFLKEADALRPILANVVRTPTS
jgi:homoserine O-acetyltransferase